MALFTLTAIRYLKMGVKIWNKELFGIRLKRRLKPQDLTSCNWAGDESPAFPELCLRPVFSGTEVVVVVVSLSEEGVFIISHCVYFAACSGHAAIFPVSPVSSSFLPSPASPASLSDAAVLCGTEDL